MAWAPSGRADPRGEGHDQEGRRRLSRDRRRHEQGPPDEPRRDVGAGPSPDLWRRHRRAHGHQPEGAAPPDCGGGAGQPRRGRRWMLCRRRRLRGRATGDAAVEVGRRRPRRREGAPVPDRHVRGVQPGHSRRHEAHRHGRDARGVLPVGTHQDGCRPARARVSRVAEGAHCRHRHRGRCPSAAPEPGGGGAADCRVRAPRYVPSPASPSQPSPASPSRPSPASPSHWCERFFRRSDGRGADRRVQQGADADSAARRPGLRPRGSRHHVREQRADLARGSRRPGR